MKSRSEVMKTRSQAAAAKKPSAAERTQPMFDEKTTAPTSVKCPACEEVSEVAALEKRDDGSYECPHCAAPITVAAGTKSAKKETPPQREPGDDTDEIEAEKEADRKAQAKEKKDAKLETRTANYCGECGAEWPTINAKRVINCGHNYAICVDDPRKAKKMKDVTPSGVTNPPSTPVDAKEHPNTPQILMTGRRISLTWGEATFPIAQYSNMKVGNFIMSREVPEGEDPLEVATRMLADLQKIADLAFDTQFTWYRKKLGLLEK